MDELGRAAGGGKMGPVPRVILSLGATVAVATFLLALWCPKPRTAPVPAADRSSLGTTFRNDRPAGSNDPSWPAEAPGVVVAQTIEGSPAYLAGLRNSDRILSLDGRPATTACDLERIVERLPLGRKVAVTFARGRAGAPETVQIETVGEAFFGQRCRDGRADACAELGRRRIVASTSEEETRDALALYEKACAADDASACAELAGQWIDRHGEGETLTEADAARTAEVARKGCDGGNPSACAHLGLLYSLGRGVAQDDARATSLYEIACDGGDPAGCYNVGLNYEKQRGAPRNDARSLLGYVYGCEGGYPQACTNLGYLYDRGIGVIAHPERAAQLYERACAGDACTPGDPIGCANLGIFLRDGHGIPKDERRAAEMLERGCDGNVAAACNNLGILVEPADADRALELYRKACRLGSEGGCKNAASPG